MAVDTAVKRRSVLNARLPWLRRHIPLPDGTIDRGDRQTLLGQYAGVDTFVERRDITITVGPLQRTRTVGRGSTEAHAGPLTRSRTVGAARK